MASDSSYTYLVTKGLVWDEDFIYEPETEVPPNDKNITLGEDLEYLGLEDLTNFIVRRFQFNRNDKTYVIRNEIFFDKPNKNIFEKLLKTKNRSAASPEMREYETYKAKYNVPDISRFLGGRKTIANKRRHKKSIRRRRIYK
jgi:hypothetical protein